MTTEKTNKPRRPFFGLTACNAHWIINRTARGERYKKYEDTAYAIASAWLRRISMAEMSLHDREQSEPRGQAPSPLAWGIEHEAEAIEAFTRTTGLIVSPACFTVCPLIPGLGAAPDGLIGNNGILEVKCPTAMEFDRRRRTLEIPPEIQAQMMAELICTGRRSGFLCNYDPLLPVTSGLNPLILYYEPTESQRALALDRITQFLNYTRGLIRDLQSPVDTAVHWAEISAHIAANNAPRITEAA